MERHTFVLRFGIVRAMLFPLLGLSLDILKTACRTEKENQHFSANVA